MEQMNVPEEMKVPIDFDDQQLPEAVRTLQPLLFEDGNGFCCVLGPDPQVGIYGCGDTPEAALLDWEADMRKRIIYHTKNDEVASYIVDKLNASQKDIG